MAARSLMSRIETGLGVFGILALGITLAIIFKWNPFPDIRDWVNDRATRLAEPATAWTQRTAGQPTAIGITGGAVVAFMGDLVESRDRGTGELKWQKQTEWAALAGPVVLVSTVDGKGVTAVDPDSGADRWKDPQAVGAWTFRDAVLTVDCGKTGCALTRRDPLTGGAAWNTAVPGTGRAQTGANHGRLAARTVDGDYDEIRSADPRPLPRHVAFLAERQVNVVDTAAGRTVRQEEVPNDSRTVLAGDRTVRTTGARRTGGCRITVTARDAATGAQAWQRVGLDLRTTGGAGCEPRNDPLGGGTTLVAEREDGRAVVLSASGGQEIAVAQPGEKVLGAGAAVAVLRAADAATIRAISLTTGATAWTRKVSGDARIGVTPHAVLIGDSGRLVAVDPGTGQVRLDVSTDADVVGVHADGVVLGRGRTIGYAAFTTST